MLSEEYRRRELQQAESLSTPVQDAARPGTLVDAERLQESEPQRPSQHKSEQAPVDLADVLRRMGISVEKGEDRTEPKGPIRRDSRPLDAGPQPSPAPAAISAEDAEEEESMEYCVARFMQNIRSREGATAAAAPAPRAKTEPTKPTGPEAHGTPAPLPPQAARAGETASPLPRAAAPETRADVLALRELAKLSAQSAISHHARGILVRRTLGKLTVSIVGLLSGGGLWWMWWMFGIQELPFYAALVAFFAGIYWGVECASLIGRLIVGEAGESRFQADGVALPHTREIEALLRNLVDVSKKLVASEAKAAGPEDLK